MSEQYTGSRGALKDSACFNASILRMDRAHATFHLVIAATFFFAPVGSMGLMVKVSTSSFSVLGVTNARQHRADADVLDT